MSVVERIYIVREPYGSELFAACDSDSERKRNPDTRVYIPLRSGAIFRSRGFRRRRRESMISLFDAGSASLAFVAALMRRRNSRFPCNRRRPGVLGDDTLITR